MFRSSPTHAHRVLWIVAVVGALAAIGCSNTARDARPAEFPSVLDSPINQRVEQYRVASEVPPVANTGTHTESLGMPRFAHSNTTAFPR